MAKREFLMLAHTYDPTKHRIAGWYVSEKLDGQRAFWDGGISRGLPLHAVPWANIAKEPDRLATGLWTRGGKPISAPDWWLDWLGPRPLDGELYAGRTRFQAVRSIVGRHTPDPGWRSIKFHVFGFPRLDQVFATASFNTTYFQRDISWDQVKGWTLSRQAIQEQWPLRFDEAYAKARILFEGNYTAFPHEQLPLLLTNPRSQMYSLLDAVVRVGGEGLIVRDPRAPWEGRRSYSMLKVKPCEDAEAVVLGYLTGKTTERGSRNLGAIGALLVKELPDGQTFELSGLTDNERVLKPNAQAWAQDHPDQQLPSHLEAEVFRRGQRITFKYNGRTAAGVPKEARYWREAADDGNS